MSTINLQTDWRKLANLPAHVLDILTASPGLTFPADRAELIDLALGGAGNKSYEVGYDVPGKGYVDEATVVKCRNGLSVNYPEAYMRRRDPDCTVLGDDKPTDRTRFVDQFGYEFGKLRGETFVWLKGQELVVLPFTLGESEHGALMVGPKNAGFFAGALADLQGMVDPRKVPENFDVCCIIYVAPPFRHTHFKGKQVVVHNRMDGLHEIFSYNLYPGPSAKKGVYGALLSIGEQEKWLTLHAATVQVVTPYDNLTTIMHEGASGSGKSEMLEFAHREEDGRFLLGKHVKTGARRIISMNQTCALHPVTDDMAMCQHGIQDASGYVRACDAESAWFVRVNHITHYGTDPHLEKITIAPKEPLLFLNIDGVRDSTVLIWEHTMDEPGKPCPNPRVVMPRHLMPDVVDGAVEVHFRNFGIRTPPCTKDQPTYGIVGFLHILPPALGWLWRLVSPRGHDNPSITDGGGMTSEGVGSYWPFATGRLVDHANLLLEQIRMTPNVRYTLTPNQYVGAYKVSFMPQWIAREYLARRGTAKFRPGLLIPARCSLLGYAMSSMQVEGTHLQHDFLRVEEQADVGIKGYDAGAKILKDFFVRELEKFRGPELSDLGKKIIDCCIAGGSVEDFEGLL
ncbi:MAG: DUF4914 family protein [Chitinispirillia bacterium]|nr:DUF4914 family protein [Chitinispirillia bacterium]MCL2241256.1 DUF4914 family protein [Chitinispirillia bacterium]